MIKKIKRSPWFLFSPFLFFYAYVIIINKWPSLYGDEIRYVDFAHNLIHGFYSPAAPHINLWNGPGYPFILLPFIAIKIPVLYITLLNGVYQYMAVVFLYKSVSLLSGNKIALICSLLLAIYPNTLSILPILYTEAFTGLLVSSLVYCVTLCYLKGSTKYIIVTGFILGYLVLTKIIFGYVLLMVMVVYALFFLLKKNKVYYVKPLKILAVAFIITIPYLFYTWSVTGKFFYWGDSGGMSLYWMSSPYENEYGDWKLPDLTNKQYPTLFKSQEAIALLRKNHSKEIKSILKHNEFDQDVLFKQIAIGNIERHPLKFVKNYYYNVSRMLFNFPYSYAYQDASIVGNIITGSLIFWTSLIGMILTVVNWRRIIAPVKLLLLITGIYLLLSAALSSYPRQLDIMLPVLLFWTGYLAANLKKPGLRFADTQGEAAIELMELTETGVIAD